MIVHHRARRGLRGLGYDSSDASADLAWLQFFSGQPSALVAYSAANPNVQPDLSGCSTWQILWGNLTGDYSGCIAANEAMIQSVPANAIAAGYSPDVVSSIQDEATEQEAQVPSDVYSIVNTQPPSPSANWFWWVLGGFGVFVLLELRKK
jgi:hypothetical protein